MEYDDTKEPYRPELTTWQVHEFTDSNVRDAVLEDDIPDIFAAFRKMLEPM